MITISEPTDTSTHLSGNPIIVTAATSEIPAGASDYKILLRIVSTDGVLVGAPFEAAITPDDYYQAEFDISGYVDQAIERDITWPIPDQYAGRWVAHVNQVYDIELIPGERYIDANDQLVENWGATWGTIFVVKGRMQNHGMSVLNQAGSNWFDYYIAGGRWLSVMPLTQKVGPWQPVKLWWKPPTTGLTFEVKAKGYYSDNSTIDWSGAPELWYDGMFEFEVQPAGMNMPPLVGSSKLKYFEVWMEGTPNVEKRTFEIDWRPVENNYYLFVDNQIGGVECLWLNGQVRFTTEGQRTIAARAYLKGSDTRNRTQYVSGNTRRRKWYINSGIKPVEEMEALQFLLDAPFAWLAIPPAGGSDDLATYTLVPVTITNTELALTNSSNDIESIELELIEAS